MKKQEIFVQMIKTVVRIQKKAPALSAGTVLFDALYYCCHPNMGMSSPGAASPPSSSDWPRMELTGSCSSLVVSM